MRSSDARDFLLVLWLKHCTAWRFLLSSHVGTMHYSHSSSLLLLSTLEANTQAILFVQNQPGNPPTFPSFSEPTVAARYYLCIVSLKPSKPKLWFSCSKSNVPWLRHNCGHSSTKQNNNKNSYSTIYQPERTHRRAPRANRDPEKLV